MRLTGARVALSATQAKRIDITIRNEKIHALGGRKNREEEEIDLSGYLVLPGLINAHDHLEFNLFPRLGRGPYPNASAWAADIYRPSDPPVKNQLSIAKSVRLFWGGIKNLASGVTTVAHHNPYEPEIFNDSFPVRVMKRYGWAHSLDFSPDMVEQFRNTPRNWPFIIHAGEGTDERSRDELTRLDKMGVLASRSVVVHAVAAGADTIALAQKRNISFVWCPSSNMFTLGRTLDQSILRSKVPIALGTDSALTGEGDLIDELRVAREVSGLHPERLYRMVTADAARILRLTRGEGTICAGAVADLLIVKDPGLSPAESLLTSLPEFVFIGGKPRLTSKSLREHIPFANAENWQPIEVEGRGAWFTDANLYSAVKAASSQLNGDFRLAGKKVRC